MWRVGSRCANDNRICNLSKKKKKQASFHFLQSKDLNYVTSMHVNYKCVYIYIGNDILLV